MNKQRWGRIVLCGFICGVAWTLLSAVLVGLIGQEFIAAVSRDRLTPIAPATRGLVFGLTVAAGVWAIWLYVSIRQLYGSRLKTAVVVGVAWWIIAGMQSAKWMALGSVSASSSVPLAIAILPAMIAAVMLGAWLYERQPKS